jgi:3-methyladenine DNA glycosylase/8-oxoguanine DNA glycosylase
VVRFTIPLRGSGGEPVDLHRTIGSHGLVRLAPNQVGADEESLALPVRMRDGRATLLEIAAAGPGVAAVSAGGVRGAGPRAELTAVVRHVLQLDADYAEFYVRAARDPALAWVTHGSGRFVRSPTAFEDVVKTICTTNCAWSATQRMTTALVAGLGEPVAGAPGLRLFPTPAAMAAAPETWYRDVARAGYRGPYLRTIAASVARGELDFDRLAGASPEELGDDDLEAQLRALPGIGPYAAAHIMMLMGRYSRLVFDSWTRPAYARLNGRKPRSDATIVRRFAPYGRFAGLAFWCYVTSDWFDNAADAAERTPASGSSTLA